MAPLTTLPARLAFSALTLVLLAACAVGPDYEVPEFDAPASWSQPAGGGLAAGFGEHVSWWEGLGDPKLSELVERALLRNLDLREAFVRLDEARALRGVAAGERWPSIDARGSYEHREESQNTPFGAFSSRTNIHALGLDAAWELDLWGRVRRAVEASERDLDASAADVRAVAVAIAAEVARAYVDRAAFERRITIALTNVDLQERTLALVRSRQEAGLVGDRDVAQGDTNVESTRSRVPLLEAGAAAARHRLAVLIGLAPGALEDELAAAPAVPRAPAEVVVGVPADLLRRRPDVVAAERRYAAEVARIGVAQGDRYPRFALGGTLGLASDGAANLFEGDSKVAGIGPSLRWSLFDGGRLKQRVIAQEARAEAAQIGWERTVLLALEEAENALTRVVREQSRAAALERAATQARRAVELAQTQYREGISDFRAVLYSERVVAGLENELAISNAAITTNLIALYKAMGGGFASPAASPETDDSSSVAVASFGSPARVSESLAHSHPQNARPR